MYVSMYVSLSSFYPSTQLPTCLINVCTSTHTQSELAQRHLLKGGGGGGAKVGDAAAAVDVDGDETIPTAFAAATLEGGRRKEEEKVRLVLSKLLKGEGSGGKRRIEQGGCR